MLSINDCLEIMHSGAEFSLKVVKWDSRRKEKRGDILEVPCAVLVWGDGGNDRSRISERAPTEMERALMGKNEIIKRNPNHALHYTRNIRVVVNGLKTETIHKIHPILIVEFNGQTTTP